MTRRPYPNVYKIIGYYRGCTRLYVDLLALYHIEQKKMYGVVFRSFLIILAAFVVRKYHWTFVYFRFLGLRQEPELNRLVTAW